MFLTRQEIRDAAGHLIIFGFEGATVSAELKELLREIKPLGLILFARNIQSPEQVCDLGRELKSLYPHLLLSVDQEGGRVARIRHPATEWPPMGQLGRLNDPALVERVGQALGAELRAMNFDVDYAPVLDVNTNPDNPIIGDRAFADDPKVVAALGARLIKGLQSRGIAACGKHFPGHGDTDVDSHLGLPYVGHDLQRLRETEWQPFKAGIDAGLGAIMTAHVVTECLDDVPATLSPRVLRHLRAELSFQGVIISDDLEMKAVADRYSVTEMGELGIQAGIDIFLACRQPEVTLELYRALVVGGEQERLSHQALADAQRRALQWRDAYQRPPTDIRECRQVVGCPAHAALVQEIQARLSLGSSL